MKARVPDGRAEDFTGVFLVVGWVCVVVIGAGTYFDGLPAQGQQAALIVCATALGLTAWTATLLTTREPWWVFACLLGTGTAGVLLDFLRPFGPGYLLAFMAIAGIGLRQPARRGMISTIVLTGGLFYAEFVAYSSVAAGLNIVIAASLVFLSTRYAGVSHEARHQDRLLAQQQLGLYQAQQKEEAMAQRSQLARELHDVLAHTLSGLALHIEGARLLAQQGDSRERLTQVLSDAHDLSREGIQSARQAVAALREDTIQHHSYDDIPVLIENARRTTQQDIAERTVGQPRTLTTDQGLTVYRVVQEALTNASRYAAPDASVLVASTWAETLLAVSISDTGGPPAVSFTGTGGYGLTGLAERAVMVGGDLKAGPIKAGGWCVDLRLPIGNDRPATHVHT